MDATRGYDEHARSMKEAESSPDHMASAGEGAGGLVRIELDGAGRLWDVVLDPQATELTVDELRTALFDAITEAQDGLRMPQPPSFEEAAADIGTAAERRFNEIAQTLHDLARRAVRR